MALGAALACLAVSAVPAYAQGSLKAHYTVSMASVTIGQVAWSVNIGDNFYTTSASGKTSGILSFLVNGDGGVAANGIVVNNRLLPTNFTSHIIDEDGDTRLRMTFANGTAREEITQGNPPTADTVPVSDTDRQGVADPLSAVLIDAAPDAGLFSPINCNRVLMIFDGRRRYDLSLSYHRNDTTKVARGYAGPVLVCGFMLRPIAGYRRDSLLVKYVTSRPDMELWFAPISGTAILAPIRVLIPTALGILRIEADRFQSAARPPSLPQDGMSGG